MVRYVTNFLRRREMKNLVVIIFLFGGLSMGIGGCSKKTCETIADECDLPNDFETACVDDYKDNRDCKKALRDSKNCLKDNGCVSDDCLPELEDMLRKCDGIYEYLATGK
jgi:hypothetical protein